MEIKFTDLPFELIGKIASFLTVWDQNNLAIVSKQLRKGVRVEQRHYINKLYNNFKPICVYINGEPRTPEALQLSRGNKYGKFTRDLGQTLLDEVEEDDYLGHTWFSFFQGYTFNIKDEYDIQPYGPFDHYFLSIFYNYFQYPNGTIRIMRISGSYKRVEGKLYPQLISTPVVRVKNIRSVRGNKEWTQLYNSLQILDENYPAVITGSTCSGYIQEVLDYIENLLSVISS